MSKKLFIFLFTAISSSCILASGPGSEPWKATPQNNLFIENKGQFPKVEGRAIEYAMDNDGTKIYFSGNGITFSMYKKLPKEEVEREEKFKSQEEYMEREREERRANMKHDMVNLTWLNANPNPQIIASEASNSYFSYSWMENAQMRNENYIKGFSKITYKDLYPGIDVEYTAHQVDGIKYALIVHPGADISQVKMKYADGGRMQLNDAGDLLIRTAFGDIIDHAPITFYSGNPNMIITSKFVRNGATVSFEVGNYNKSQTLIIDPWTQTPGLNNSHGVWECEKDASGNVYIIGGDMPMKLQKYNSSGTLQWTYNTPWDTANNWLGTFATDLTGISYVTSGSIAALQKVSNAGALIASYTAGGGSTDEYWNIAFNCDQTKLVVGGTRLNFSGLSPIGDGVIFDINTTTLAINSMQKVGKCRPGFGGFNDPEEVRSITASYNARYYFLTLDTLGAIDQNFGVCSGTNGSILFRMNDGYSFGYKCEDWRPKGNSGIMSVRANKNFVYTQNGLNVQKRDLNTGAVLATSAIPGGISTTSLGFKQPGNSGIDIDSCGNVYVGSGNAVVKYDANLNQLASTAVSYHVYDVAVSYGGNIIACGATGTSSSTSRTGYVQQINMSACDPSVLSCCDANVCSAGPFCITDPNYTLTPSTAGGTWSGTGVSAGGVFSPSTAGTGTHVVTYSLACGTNSVSIVVNNCQAINVCINNGTLTASGGTPSYTWSTQTSYTPCISGFSNYCGLFTAAGTPTFSWTTQATGTNTYVPGSYPVLVTDGAGQTYTIATSGSVPNCSVSCTPPTITFSNVTPVNCYNGSDGAATATAAPAGTYTYTWQPGTLTGATQNALASGVYTVTASDGNGCAGTGTVSIAQPFILDASVASTGNVSCNGMTNGTASLSISGGTPNYTVTWSNSSTGNPITGVGAGTYTATITDAHGCIKTKTVTITEPPAITMSVTSTPAACGSPNGSATASAGGGTGTITYSWNTGASGATLSGVAGGTYTAYATDANGCKDSIPVTINNTGGPTANAAETASVTCNGGTNGTASVSISGGTPGYSVNWSGGTGSGTTVNGLGAGTYTATVTDTNGCITTATVTISEPTPIAITFTNNSPSSCTSPTGSVTANASGGTGVLTYSWSTGATGQTLGNVNAGIYTVTVTDANNCTQSSPVTINTVNGPTLTTSGTTPPSCNGGTNGTATVSINGGTPSYTVTWSAGTGSGTSVSGLGAGTYSASVIDAGGCTAVTTFTVSQPPSITVTVNSSPTGCVGSTGSATVNATGGTGIMTYTWSNSQNGSTATGLGAGVYTVTTTDANSCTATQTVSVGISNSPTVSANSSPTGCVGSTGSATATATGTGPMTYTWSNSQTGQTATGLGAGVYTVTATDGNGCTATQTVSVGISNPPVVTVDSVLNVLCNGQSNGGAWASATGGTPAYTFTWSNAQTGTSSSGWSQGSYSVVVTDAGGCKDTATFTISEPTALAESITSTSVEHCNKADGSTTASTNGGTPNYTYQWSSGAGTATAGSLAAGTYTVIVTDANGCKDTTTATINPVAGPTLSLTGQTDITCNGMTNGSATVSASGGTPVLTYTWTGGGGSSTTASGLGSGSYTATVVDSAGCVSSVTVAIQQPGALVVNTSGTPVSCSGGSNGSATVTVAGGTSPYTEAWSNSQSGTTASGLSLGAYTVVVTDSHGCKDSSTVVITENPPIDSLMITGSICVNDANVSLNAPAGTGIAAPYQWYQSSGAIAGAIGSTYTGSTSTANANGYSVTWFHNGCRYITTTTSITVNQDVGTLEQANVFTPNDDKINDTYLPFNVGALGPGGEQLLSANTDNYELIIYDRWGIKLFQTTSILTMWDGKTPDGKNVMDGTYYWIAKYTPKCSKLVGEQIIKGFVQLVR